MTLCATCNRDTHAYTLNMRIGRAGPCARWTFCINCIHQLQLTNGTIPPALIPLSNHEWIFNGPPHYLNPLAFRPAILPIHQLPAGHSAAKPPLYPKHCHI